MLKNFKKKKNYSRTMKTKNMNQEMKKMFRWKQMTTVAKKKMIKANIEQEELEYRRKVGSISKQEMNTPKNTVRSQRRS
jgi:hypothetical protein